MQQFATRQRRADGKAAACTFQAGWVKAEWLQQLTDALMANLTLFLVPPCVAVISYLDLIADSWLSILVSAAASTVCVLLVTGKVHQWIREKI